VTGVSAGLCDLWLPQRITALMGDYGEEVNSSAAIRVTAVRVAELLAEGELMPVYVHIIDHPEARVLVDTGMTQLHPAVADMDPRLYPLDEQDFDLGSVDIVVNSHLHFDHCGGNHLFAGKPVYVQRQELEDARNENDYTILEWVDPPGMHYVPVDRELELLPGCGFFRHQVTPGDHRSWSLMAMKVRPSSPEIQQFGSVNLITLARRASCWCAL
jgi:hypothetical protein